MVRQRQLMGATARPKAVQQLPAEDNRASSKDAQPLSLQTFPDVFGSSHHSSSSNIIISSSRFTFSSTADRPGSPYNPPAAAANNG
jgi:hypothetical protein